MTTETIVWRSVADALPDADETVLIWAPQSGEPVWMGFFDGSQWYEIDGMPTSGVTHWSRMPEGPANAQHNRPASAGPG